MRPCVKCSVVILMLVAGLVCESGAYADTLSWSITGTGVLGSGTFTATNEGGGEYLVTAMTGSLLIDGVGGAITGFTPYTGTPGTYGVDPSGLYDFDDLVNPSSTPELDIYGLVFSVSGITSPLNLCSGTTDCAGSGSQYWLLDSAATGGFSDQVNFSDAVPEPSAMGLLSLGLLGLMLVLRRERLRAC